MEFLDYLFYGLVILAASVLPVQAVYMMMEEGEEKENNNE